uniref:Uncharacterized protein n=1 Tax=Oryza glumipatula TaxID=40148 RepID=A0A0E0AU42_9ORYZ
MTTGSLGGWKGDARWTLRAGAGPSSPRRHRPYTPAPASPPPLPCSTVSSVARSTSALALAARHPRSCSSAAGRPFCLLLIRLPPRELPLHRRLPAPPTPPPPPQPPAPPKASTSASAARRPGSSASAVGHRPPPLRLRRRPSAARFASASAAHCPGSSASTAGRTLPGPSACMREMEWDERLG